MFESRRAAVKWVEWIRTACGPASPPAARLVASAAMSEAERETRAQRPLRPEPGGPAHHELARRSSAHVELTLLRHGEPDWAPGGGASVRDPGLTPYGAAQARAAGIRSSTEEGGLK